MQRKGREDQRFLAPPAAQVWSPSPACASSDAPEGKGELQVSVSTLGCRAAQQHAPPIVCSTRPDFARRFLGPSAVKRTHSPQASQYSLSSSHSCADLPCTRSRQPLAPRNLMGLLRCPPWVVGCCQSHA
eukprot:221864-Pleurochrysis_carterae.AAC.2